MCVNFFFGGVRKARDDHLYQITIMLIPRTIPEIGKGGGRTMVHQHNTPPPRPASLLQQRRSDPDPGSKKVKHNDNKKIYTDYVLFP